MNSLPPPPEPDSVRELLAPTTSLASKVYWGPPINSLHGLVLEALGFAARGPVEPLAAQYLPEYVEYLTDELILTAPQQAELREAVIRCKSN